MKVHLRAAIKVTTLFFVFTLSIVGSGLQGVAREDATFEELLVEFDKAPLGQKPEIIAKLRSFGPKALPHAPKVISRLDTREQTDHGEYISRMLALVLTDMGPEVLPLLVKEIDSDDLYRSSGAMEAIYHLGPRASAVVPEIDSRLGKWPEEKTWGLLYLVEGVGKDAEKLQPKIEPYLDSKDFQLRLITCRALAALGPASKPAVPKLLKYVHEGNASERGHAALALGSIGPVEGYDIVGELCALLTYNQFVVRQRALEALGKMGKQAEAALPKIDELLNNPGYNAPVDASLAHWAISGDAELAIARMTKFMENKNHELPAIVALGKMKSAGKGATSILEDKLTSNEEDVKFEAAQSLGEIGAVSMNGEELLKKLAAMKDGYVSDAAADALIKLSVKKGK